jgi:hypothetical protein
LVNLGWLAEFPYPSADRLSEISARFLPPKDEEPPAPAENAEEEPKETDGFEALLAGLWRHHTELVQTARTRCYRTSGGLESEEAEIP